MGSQRVCHNRETFTFIFQTSTDRARELQQLNKTHDYETNFRLKDTVNFKYDDKKDISQKQQSEESWSSCINTKQNRF